MHPAVAGKTYQLWLITDRKKMISVGVFAVKDAQGEVVNPKVPAIPPDSGAVQFAAVTVEPDGGMPQPTSAPVMTGTLQDIR